MASQSHESLTIEQFTRQAVPFAEMASHAAAMEVLIDMSRPGAADRALDVACGPGLVACRFAPLVAHITGLDITPEMIRQAEKAQREQKLVNMDWKLGPAAPLPFDDGQFTLVLTRYSLHHFLNPREVLAEMIRVCAPGGRVLVADVVLPPEKVALYDRLEKLRDPSHVHALSRDEFAEMLRTSGLESVQFQPYRLKVDLETILGASFPVEGGAEQIRQAMRADIGIDRIGVQVAERGGAVEFAFPISVACGIKRA